jgi:hypothetical protein
VGHFCRTAQQMNWGGLKNGDLLNAAEPHFDLFITADQSIRYQQNLSGRKIAIIELSTNKLRRIELAGSLLLTAIQNARPETYLRLEIP